MSEPAFYVCPPYDGRLMMADNLKGTCQLCRCTVQYRPGGPERAEVQHGSVCTMICMKCAVQAIPTMPDVSGRAQ